jgi:hypothetical protein
MKSWLLCLVTFLFCYVKKTHNNPLFVKQIVKFIFIFTQNKKDNQLMFIPNRLHFHYENLLHQDLLLKLNYANIMEVPILCKIIVVLKAPSNLIRNVKLTMEIICSQKFTQTQSINSIGRSFDLISLYYIESQRKTKNMSLTWHKALYGVIPCIISWKNLLR